MASISQQQPHSSFLDWFIHQGWFLVTLTDCRLYILHSCQAPFSSYFKKCIMYQDHDNFIFGEMFSVIACIGQTLRSCFLNILTRIHSKKKTQFGSFTTDKAGKRWHWSDGFKLPISHVFISKIIDIVCKSL